MNWAGDTVKLPSRDLSLFVFDCQKSPISSPSGKYHRKSGHFAIARSEKHHVKYFTACPTLKGIPFFYMGSS